MLFHAFPLFSIIFPPFVATTRWYVDLNPKHTPFPNFGCFGIPKRCTHVVRKQQQQQQHNNVILFCFVLFFTMMIFNFIYSVCLPSPQSMGRRRGKQIRSASLSPCTKIIFQIYVWVIYVIVHSKKIYLFLTRI